MIEKKDGELQPSWTVEQAYHAWQAYTPWPGLFFMYRDARVTLLEIQKHAELSVENPGTWILYDKLPAVVLSDGILTIKSIHPAGKKPMTGEEFVRGFMRD